MPALPSHAALRTCLRGAFDAAVAAADPLRIVPAHLPAPPSGRVIVIGAGKAATSMAVAVERTWPGVTIGGLVVTRYGHGLPTRHIEVIEAGHPVPDAAGEDAARRMLALTQDAGEDDLVLVLMSGGASSLLALPAGEVTMAELKAVTHALLRSGANIREMNCVRKHLSRIAGGRLVQTCRAHVLALLISDVPGDDPSTIGSGPTVPDPTTYADALAILSAHGVAAPDGVRAHLEAGAAGRLPETPKPGDPCFARADHRVIATARGAIDAGCRFLSAQGIEVLSLGEIEGEAGEVARAHAALVAQRLEDADRSAKPFALVSGGECTVTVRGRGRGGRCSEYLLHLAMALDAAGLTGRVAAIACDTDGIDGSEDNAGALLLPDTMARARVLGLDAQARAADNDAWGFFSALGDLVVTGPTRTNVNDFRVIVAGVI